MKLSQLFVATGMVSFALSAAASTNGLGEALFRAFAIWCGIPALVLAITGAIVPRLGYWRSLGVLIATIFIEFAISALRTQAKYPGLHGQMGEAMVGALLASFYASLLHAFVYWLTGIVRRILSEDDAKQHADAQQRVPGDRPASRTGS